MKSKIPLSTLLKQIGVEVGMSIKEINSKIILEFSRNTYTRV